MTGITARQKKAFGEQGYLILKSAFVGDLKKMLRRDLKETAMAILGRHAAGRRHAARLARLPFGEIFDWCVAHEKDNAISRVFYELFPQTPSVLTLASHPAFVQTSKKLGLAFPLPSTLPILRIDRPSETRYLEPSHQDYWYSMLSANAVTYWFPVLPVTEDMGDLLIFPRSHRRGLRPIRPWTDGSGTRYALRDEVEESSYVPLRLAENEIVVFSQFLVHKSGNNRGTRARLTLQVRHNDLATLRHLTSSYTPKHSVFTAQAQRDLLERSSGKDALASRG